MGVLACALVAVAFVAYCASQLPGSRPILDDAFGVIHHDVDLLSAWTLPAYGGVGWAWGPLPGSLQWAVARALGHDSIVPFRALCLVVHLLACAGGFMLARRLGARALDASLLATLALVHPFTIDVAGWASAAFDGVSGLVAAWGLWAFARWRSPWLAGVCTLAVGLCKPAALGLVAVFPLLELGLGGGVARASRALAGAALGAAVYAVAYLSVVPQTVSGVAAFVPIEARLFAWLGYVGWFVPPPFATFAHFTPRTLAEGSGGIVALLCVGVGAFAVRRQPRGAASWWLPIAGASWCVLLVLPAAIPAATLGLAPFRYAYLATMLSLPLLAAGLSALPPRAVFAIGVLGIGLSLPGARRVRELRGPLDLFAAEAAREPTNPLPVTWAGPERLAAAATRQGAIDAVAAWDEAVASLPLGVRVPDPVPEQTRVAAAWFRLGEWRRALDAARRATDRLAVYGPAWCVQADALDRLGQPAEAAAAAAKCAP